MRGHHEEVHMVDNLVDRHQAAILVLGRGKLAEHVLPAAFGAAATREESVILVPVTTERLTLGSGGTDAHYLELVTRDTALMLLNRAPESLDYWMEQVLKVADPSAHGRLKAELVKIVDEQRGSDISQAFVISRMEVDAQALTAVVTGTLKTFVGAQVIASQERSFTFRWSKRGLSLALTGFEQNSTQEDQDQ